MTERFLLAGGLAIAAALSPPPAIGQAPTAVPRPAPPPVTPAPLPAPAPALAPPVVAPPPAPAPAVSYDTARTAESREYSFDDDTVDGELARPDAAYAPRAATAPPDAPAYSDLCKATPRPPWCSEATKGGSGN